MGIGFDKNDPAVNLSIADNAALTLQDGDWAVAGWVKLNDNVGSGGHNLFQYGTFGANNSLWIWIEEGQAGGNQDDIVFRAVDGDGTNTGNVASTSNPFLNNMLWTHLLLQKTAGAIKMYVDASEVSTVSSTGFNAVNPSTFQMGFSGGSYLIDGALAEWSKWNRAMNSSERTALAGGAPASNYSTNLDYYMKMRLDWTEEIVPLTITNNGTRLYAGHPITYTPTLVPNVPLINPTRTILIELQDT